MSDFNEPILREMYAAYDTPLDALVCSRHRLADFHDRYQRYAKHACHWSEFISKLFTMRKKSYEQGGLPRLRKTPHYPDEMVRGFRKKYGMRNQMILGEQT